jgi:hypothetical protein
MLLLLLSIASWRCASAQWFKAAASVLLNPSQRMKLQKLPGTFAALLLRLSKHGTDALLRSL